MGNDYIMYNYDALNCIKWGTLEKIWQNSFQICLYYQNMTLKILKTSKDNSRMWDLRNLVGKKQWNKSCNY